ncbi:MAG: DNA topoisomerase IV [Bacteroidetes bacterium GWE2_29_8]|nr:MAG: DNA topoisomerase IV [Bacteroidetes bacterium GWE2_29_8]OFY17755.1 MAG: DNA topoisomerase IV [Bacteroidetes bacterium GWF2_29_10]
MAKTEKYTDESVISLKWNQHIRLRPGMYIGKLGDGSSPDDGIYVLIKEIIDNSIDECIMGFGDKIEINITNHRVHIRDYGRGIPLGKVKDCVSKINTGAKYDSKVFKKTVGLNGVGAKAVNALSSSFSVQSFRDGRTKKVEFEKGNVKLDVKEEDSQELNGTEIIFTPDTDIFGDYHYIIEYIEKLVWNYVYLNKGIKIYLNDVVYFSENGLLDLLNKNIDEEILYPIIHIIDGEFECAITHSEKHSYEDYYSFVNGQYTREGGTHLNAFKEAYVKTIREFYNKDYDASDVRTAIIAAISVKIQEPVFESQTKTKLGSTHIEAEGQTVKSYVTEIIKRTLDNYLHKNPATAESIQKKIVQAEKERKELYNIRKVARESAKKASIHNKKLRDCRVHYDSNHEQRLNSTLFITEGNSASGSITKSREVNTQAVFSLKGKPLNCFGLTKKTVYENEEFNLLQNALNIDDGLEGLRYNNVVIATDADVDGMHIRLLMLTFFMQFYPELIKAGHVYLLQTPLFRIRKKDKNIYCYSEDERLKALVKLGKDSEITRFKGLGEISPDEFKAFIGPSMRLEPVILRKDDSIKEILTYFMGKNTPSRQVFIIDNLRYDIAQL